MSSYTFDVLRLASFLEQYVDYVREARFGIIASGALLAFILQPYVGLLPGSAISSALVLCSALVGFHAADARKDRATLAANAVAGAVGLGFLALLFANAIQRTYDNDRRCAAIQHHMLTIITSRADDAAMMQALGCRPQGDERVSYPAQPPRPQPAHLPYDTKGHPSPEASEPK